MSTIHGTSTEELAHELSLYRRPPDTDCTFCAAKRVRMSRGIRQSRGEYDGGWTGSAKCAHKLTGLSSDPVSETVVTNNHVTPLADVGLLVGYVTGL